jgi:alpha-mannosidase
MHPSNEERIVHLIFNAHIDPAWLWPWQAGLDEAIATCRSACDRLAAHPDLVFTRGEAWVHREVELCDPALFERIRGFVKEGRWHVVGGWWIQPDCNGPSAWAMDRQAELGLAYFEKALGLRPRTAYNVDSFGHAPYLPALMKKHGQDRYVMMRPQEHEMTIPARAFRWRGYEDGPEVTVFRIAGAYCTGQPSVEHIERSLQDLPKGSRHTMCFMGLGDHGGGPTENQLAWLRENWNAIPGVRLEFSHPDRFFDAVEAEGVELPLVVGEMQYHAVGCYSVCHDFKVGVRKAEHLLSQAEGIADRTTLERAWERVVFAHFHDIYGGTCIPSAYPSIHDGLGYARSTADQVLQGSLRRRLTELPDDEHQRIVLWNASDRPFTGYVEHEPWMGHIDGSSATLETCEVDSHPVEAQVLRAEATCVSGPRMLFRTELGAGEIKAYRIRTDREQSWSARAGVKDGGLWNDAGVKAEPFNIEFRDGFKVQPRLQIIEDPTDTWSHKVDRFGEDACAEAVWDPACTVDDGPLMGAVTQLGKIGQSRLLAEWRVYAGEAYAELLLTVHWQEARKLLKLTVPVAGEPPTRLDGVMGGTLERSNDGAERPLRDFTISGKVCLVCPDAFALDGTPERLRLTLLRSAVMAHHDPHDGTGPRITISDQGVHLFRFRFYAPGTPADRLDADAACLQRPLIAADLTRGMKPL